MTLKAVFALFCPLKALISLGLKFQTDTLDHFRAIMNGVKFLADDVATFIGFQAVAFFVICALIPGKFAKAPNQLFVCHELTGSGHHAIGQMSSSVR